MDAGASLAIIEKWVTRTNWKFDFVLLYLEELKLWEIIDGLAEKFCYPSLKTLGKLYTLKFVNSGKLKKYWNKIQIRTFRILGKIVLSLIWCFYLLSAKQVELIHTLVVEPDMTPYDYTFMRIRTQNMYYGSQHARRIRELTWTCISTDANFQRWHVTDAKEWQLMARVAVLANATNFQRRRSKLRIVCHCEWYIWTTPCQRRCPDAPNMPQPISLFYIFCVRNVTSNNIWHWNLILHWF